MDESMLRKARNLADGFAAADTDDVALVLGEALLEALAELLVPEGEREEGEVLSWENAEAWGRINDPVADAKRQHPAYLPTHKSCWLCKQRRHRGPCKSASDMRPMRSEPSHPEFLEGEAAYEAAPVGTLTDDGLERITEGWWDRDEDAGVADPLFTKRKVKRWGYGD